MRRVILITAVAAAAVSGCIQPDENPDWDPQADLPGWTYDAPFYYRPSEELQVAEVVGDGIPVYYSHRDYFFIRHPGGSQVVGEPRVEVKYSPNQGNVWKRAGFFGVEQTHFCFHAERDGNYWIRFVGPSQGVSKVPPGTPHRIYVVDTSPPNISLTVTPPPWEQDEEGNRVPHIYKVGETVTLRWQVRDKNLRPDSIKMETCFAKFPYNMVWSRFPAQLEPVGATDVEIPPEAVRDGGIRFRVEAKDKAGNTGAGLTEILQIAESEGVGPIQRVKVDKDDIIQQTHGTPGERPGWPDAGELLRGGTSRILAWIPKEALQYDTVNIQFSANDGRSWRTIKSGVDPRKQVRWTVPSISSKNCRLRIFALAEDDSRIMLATTRRFIVDTVAKDTIIGPKEIPSTEKDRLPVDDMSD